MLESYYKTEDEKNFTEREVSKLVCMTNLVESVIRANFEYPHSDISHFDFENIRNLTHQATCEDCGSTDCNNNHCNACGSDEVGYPIKEILEWWLVDNFQARHLEALGEPMLYAGGQNFWGRTCSGQSIILDGTFQKIYRVINE